MTPSQHQFAKAIEKLNTPQKEAVERIDGPVMVLAGPGTGKTEVLATRIGQILTETDMQPSNILCLTFSNAGVQSMEKRLLELLGPEGESIEVHTYHSFANKILFQNIEKNNLSESGLLSDVQRFMILEKLLSNANISGKYFELKPANKVRLSSLSRLFSFFKQNAITSKSLEMASLHTINNVLPYVEGYFKKDGELNSEGKKLQQKIIDFTQGIAPMYEEYLKILKERNKYEYDDMLDQAVKVLNEDDSLLCQYQETYQYILVDEFQDTNIKQLNLLEVLVRDVEQPNLFIVGDDDQCVYKFQGANTENFNWIQQMIPDMKVILLDTNYRSTESILRSSFSVIQQNENRYALKSAPLIVGVTTPAINNIPIIRSYKNEEQESFGIATEINKIINEEGNNVDIAVLFRNNKESASIKKWLNYYKIQFTNNQSKENLLETSFGQRMYYLTQFIRLYNKNNELAIIYFFKLMMEFGYTEKLLITFLNYKKDSTEETNYLQWILSRESHKDCNIIITELQKLIELSKSADLAINNEVNELYIQYVSKDTLTDQNILSTWSEFINSFELSDKLKTYRSLSNHLWYYNIYSLSIPIESQQKGKKGVILSTIHSSKGLEYNTVFVKGCQNKNWEDAANPWNGIRVPKVLNQMIKQDSDEIEDIRRILYVALTRAKTKLHVSYCADETLKYPLKKSILLDPLLMDGIAHTEEITEIELPVIESDAYDIKANDTLMALLKERVEAFAISTSSTHNWLQCQNKFFFLNICKLTDEGNEAMSFGSFIHEILECVAKDIAIQYSNERMVELIDNVFEKFKYNFHPLHQNGYKNAARQISIDYLRERPFLKKPEEIESYLRYKMSNGVVISGMLDRLEFYGDFAKVIDYKTGKYYPNNKKFLNDQEIGSPYWRQGMMYNYLINGNYGDKYTIDFSFHYVEEKEDKNKVKVFQYEENKGYEDWLLQMWKQIQEMKFNKSCADGACVYCRERVDN